MSVGYHLIAYGGRDDKLFRAGIMESGGSINANPANSAMFRSYYDQIVDQASFANLNAIINSTSGSPAYYFTPVVDGDLLRTWGSFQIDKHEFVKVPILAGSNTDEGSSWRPTDIYTTQQWHEYLTSMNHYFTQSLRTNYHSLGQR
jgi:triacylglycerol lipase